MSRCIGGSARRLERATLVFTALIVLILGCGWLTANADAPIELVAQQHSYEFAHHMTFSAQIASASPISGITLLFAERDDLRVFSAAMVVKGDSTSENPTYTLDLTSFPLRPFAYVEYWWYVEAADGSRLETEPAAFMYADNRYDWRTVADDPIRVHWAANDPALGHTAARISRDGLERMQTFLAEPLTRTVDIYIYPSQGELVSALRLTGRDWIAGQADPELGAILVSADGSPADIVELQRTIPHEIAHMVIYQSSGGRNSQVPPWLHEGLAVNNEVRPDPALTSLLQQAVADNALLPLASLCAPFSGDQPEELLAYAQSASLVQYVQNQHGNLQLRRLLAAYGDGADCRGGVERVLGLTLETLETQWRASLHGTRPATAEPAADPSGLLVWLGLVLGAAALAVLLYLVGPRKQPRSEAEYGHLA